MPKALMVGENAITCAVSFNNTKTGQADFVNNRGIPVTFSVAPSVSITLDQNSTSIPYRFSWVKSGNLFTGIIIKFNTYYTGTAFVQVLEQ